jgi:hypothetical protein
MHLLARYRRQARLEALGQDLQVLPEARARGSVHSRGGPDRLPIPRRSAPPNSHAGPGARAQPLDFVQLARDGERVEIPAGHHYVPVTRLVEVRLGETARERARARTAWPD